MIPTFARFLTATLAFVLAQAALAQVTARWSHAYALSGFDIFPSEVAIDGAGNVYGIGYKSNGTNPTTAVAFKYSTTGTFVWSRSFYSAAGESDARIEATEDGQVYVAMTHPVSTSYTSIARLNPTNGSIVWQRYYEADKTFDLLVRETSPRRIIVVAHDRRTSPFKVRTISLDEIGGLIGQHNFIAPADDWSVTDVEKMSDGNFAYLVGSNPGSFDPASTRLVYMTANGAYLRQRALGTGRFLATSATAGGRVFTAGASSTTTIVLNCLSATGALLNSRTDSVPSSTKVTLYDAMADATGCLYVAGQRESTGPVKSPLLARYSYPGLMPLWRFTAAIDPSEERFEGLERDQFGLIFASSVSSTNGYRVHGIDALTGRFLGRTTHGFPAAFTSPFEPLAINDSGTVGSLGSMDATGDNGMLLQRVQGVGLRSITLPTSVTGGNSVQGTITMYLPAAFSRTIKISTNSPYVSIVSSIQIVAGQTTALFTMNTSVPPGDLVTTVVADDGKSRRVITFLLRK